MNWSRAALIVYLVVVGAGLFLLAQDEAKLAKRLGPESKVTVAGPCRTFGPDHPECRRQSRLIVKSCLTHRDCRALIRTLYSDENDRRGQANESNGSQDLPPDQSAPEGGGSQQTEPPSQQPGPGDGADGDNGGTNPPPTPPPTEPPAQPNTPELLDPVTEPVCNLTGVCL